MHYSIIFFFFVIVTVINASILNKSYLIKIILLYYLYIFLIIYTYFLIYVKKVQTCHVLLSQLEYIASLVTF